jgi:hypothetical protein
MVQQAAQGTDPVEALTLRHVSFGLLQRSWYPAAALLGASAAVALRTGALPRWLAWAGVLGAAGLLATPVVLVAVPTWGGWVFVHGLFGLWVAATGVVLARRPPATEA